MSAIDTVAYEHATMSIAKKLSNNSQQKLY